jgi:hypothetical protein
MQSLIYIQDELVLEAHLDGHNSYILLKREGVPGPLRVYLSDVRYLMSALGSMATKMAGVIVGDDPKEADG